MGVYQIRNELRKMNRRYLFSLATAQKISKCLVGGQTCCLHLRYQGLNFCISEIIGQGCQVEKSAQLEEISQKEKGFNRSMPLLDRIGISPLPPRKDTREFKVYRRDPITRSMIFLGRVAERRIRERGNNLNDLLTKAVRDYSSCVAAPSTIFLLSS